MSDQIHFFVHSVHAIGGVTTWAFQAVNFLSLSHDAYVLSVCSRNTDIPNQHLFPGPTINISMQSQHPDGRQEQMNRKRKAQKAQKTTRTKKAVLPRKERKPTLPLKTTLDRLDTSAEMAIEQAGLFIPNYIEFGYKLAAISRLRNKPSRCIGICHTDQHHYYDLLTRYEPIIQSFVAVSSRCAQNLHAVIPHRAEDIHTVPYGVYLPLYLEKPRFEGPIRLLYTGRFVKNQKRILDFVELIKYIEVMNINYIFDLFGTGPDESELVSAIANYSRVRVRQGVPHSQMTNIYQGYDVLLLASETEGTSIAMLEGMAHGLVPIVTRVSGAEDVITNGWNGFLVEVGDIQALSEKVAILSRNSEIRAKMSKRAYKTIEKDYTAESQLKVFSEVIRESMQKPIVSSKVALTCFAHNPSRIFSKNQ